MNERMSDDMFAEFKNCFADGSEGEARLFLYLEAERDKVAELECQLAQTRSCKCGRCMALEFELVNFRAFLEDVKSLPDNWRSASSSLPAVSGYECADELRSKLKSHDLD